MRAAIIEERTLVLRDVPKPDIGPGEILIRNVATAVNRADLAQVAGGYPAPPGASDIPGLECAGEVVALGEGVARFRVGESVCALLSGGGYGEFVAVAAGQALPLPAGIPVHEAAALPEVFATAFLNVFMEAGLQRGERLLLHAGASGVGTAGIQLARAFGNEVWVTAGSDDKVAHCVELGAAAGWNRDGGGSFAEQAAEWTGGAGFDVILDPVGAAYLTDNLKTLAVDGRLVIIGLLGGAKAEVNLGHMMMRRQRIIGSTLRARSVAAKARVMDQLGERVWPAIEAGKIRPIIDTRLPIEEVQRGHELLAENRTVGKVMLDFQGYR